MATNTEQLTAWLNGTVTGGPNADGYYPLTRSDGVVVLVPCPALAATDPVADPAPVEIFANQASAAADSAAASATAADASATSAAASASAADTSATNAAADATAANTSKTNAASSASSAATSASNAANSETNAATSASTATTQADLASSAQAAATASRDKAAQWAESAEDVPVETGQYSAKHWAAKAAASGGDKLSTSGGTIGGANNANPLDILRVGGTQVSVQFTTDAASKYFGLASDGTFRVGLSADLAATGAVLWTDTDFDPDDKANLAGANFTGPVSVTGGFSVPNTTVTAPTDLTKHINLYGGTYGFSISPATVNYVSDTNHVFYCGGVEAGRFTSDGSSFQVQNAIHSEGSLAAINFEDRTTASARWSWYATGGTARLWREGVGDILTVPANGIITSSNQFDAPTLISRTVLYSQGTFYQRNAPNTSWIKQPRIFVQSTDPGASAADGDIWLW